MDLISDLSVFIVSKIINLIEKLVFFPRLKREIKNLKNIRLIIDVGANKGQSIQFFLKNFPDAKIIGFEPNERLNKFLRKLESEKCKIYNLGLSNITGQQTFYENILDETSSFAKPASESKWGKLKQIILLSTAENIIKEKFKRVITLDEFCSEHHITCIDYLKIDVEGFEHNVLIGADSLLRDGLVKNIQLENQKNDLHNNDYEEIMNLLDHYNYKIMVEIPHGFGKIYDIVFTKS